MLSQTTHMLWIYDEWKVICFSSQISLPASLTDRLKQLETNPGRSSYDPYFEHEILAQIRIDKKKRDKENQLKEDRWKQKQIEQDKEQREMQDIAITQWVEQQQQQRGEEKERDRAVIWQANKIIW